MRTLTILTDDLKNSTRRNLATLLYTFESIRLKYPSMADLMAALDNAVLLSEMDIEELIKRL